MIRRERAAFTLGLVTMAAHAALLALVEAVGLALWTGEPWAAAAAWATTFSASMATIAGLDLARGMRRPTWSQVREAGPGDPQRLAKGAPASACLAVSWIAAFGYHLSAGDAAGTVFMLTLGTLNIFAASASTATGSDAMATTDRSRGVDREDAGTRR